MIFPKKFSIKIDNFFLLFVVFALILSLLFAYLVNGDRSIRNYDSYRQSLQKMTDLEHRWDTVFFLKYHYIDHDETSRISKIFNEQIDFLKNSTLKEEFGTHIFNDFMIVEKAYRTKYELLVWFESLNANLTNSVHTMFDLKKNINIMFRNDHNRLHLANTIFFNIGQIYMGMPYDKREFDKLVEKLKAQREGHRLFKYLYMHLENFITNVEKLNAISARNATIDLSEKISHLSDELSLRYSQVREKQKMIAIGFFLMAFLILFLLIYNYFKVKRSTKELLAFRYAIENSDNAIVLTDANRHIEFVNEAFEINTGYSREDVYGQNPNILKSDLVAPEVFVELNKTLDRGEKWQGELINKRKDGSLLYEKASIVPIFMDEELVQYLAIKLDVTEYVMQQKILQQSATVFNSIADGILITDKRKKILSVNPAFLTMFGYRKEELLGKEPMVIMSLKENEAYYKTMWHKLMTSGRWSGKVDNATKEGKMIPIWLTIAVVRDEKEEIQNFIAIYTNLEEIMMMEKKVNFLAYHDSLTKLPNRTLFESRIVDILALAEKEARQVAILFIDLDRFKVINDTLGHHIGDEMLIQLAQRIKAQIDETTLLARIGGDEFVVVVNVESHKREVALLAERLLSVIREPILIDDYHLNTTASIGIAVYPNDGVERREIVKHADSAMYYAKEEGKDTYRFYTKQLSLDVQARLNLEQELLHALNKKELTLDFQPQYDLLTRKVVGAEALLRWKNRTLGVVSPEQFIAIAEETGIIIDIGYFVFEEACKAYMSWREVGIEMGSISINISSIQFREEDVFGKFEEIILQTGIPAHKIEIEITEHFIMEYSTTNLTILENLRNIGCKISIDDFGTGYSSMSYLKRLAIDEIKIDKSFVTDLPHDSHDVEVSKAIIALSKSLGYKIVAEGIETKEQELFLKEHGCDIGQGFYFAKPMSSEKIIAFMKAQS